MLIYRLLSFFTVVVASSYAMDIRCVSSAFISCSLSGATRSASLSPTESAGNSDNDNVRCPFDVYECLKSHEVKCPLVKKFVANLQAVCEPERRRYIAEFQMCSQAVDNECGTEGDDPDTELDEYDELDEVALESLLTAKCDALRKRHMCAHEVFARERCSTEAINYFENNIVAEMAEANMTNCRLVAVTTNEDHRLNIQSMGSPFSSASNDDPAAAVGSASSSSRDGGVETISLTNTAELSVNEVPYALKRELKPNTAAASSSDGGLSSSSRTNPSSLFVLCTLVVATAITSSLTTTRRR